MSLFPDKAVAEVNARIDVWRLLELIDYKVNKLQDAKETVRGFCPIHKESVFRTLIVDKNQRTFRCMYGLCEGADGGNLVRLLALARKTTVDEAVKTLIKEFDLTIDVPVDEAALKSDLEMASNLLDMNEPAEAEAVIVRLVEAAPDMMEVRELELCLRRAQDDSPGQIPPLRHLARQHAASRRWDGAMQAARDWTELEPDAPEPMTILAECTLAGGDVEGAIWEFMAVADHCEAAGDFSGAVDAYLRVEALQEQHGTEMVDLEPHLVRALEASGRAGEAVEHLHARAERAATRGESARAADFLTQAMAADPEGAHPELRVRLAEMAPLAPRTEALHGPEGAFAAAIAFLVSAHRFDKAIAALEKWLDVDPADEASRNRLIDLYYTQGMNVEGADLEVFQALATISAGDPATAQARVAKLLEWQPEHPGALDALAVAEEALGNAGGARNARRRQAKALASRRDFEAAAAILRALVQAEPEAIDLAEQLAQTLESHGKSPGGPAAALAAAATLYGDLANRLLEATSSGRAMVFLERAAALSPNEPARLFDLASAYLRVGASAGARDAVIRGAEQLFAEGKLDEAILQAEQFLALMPREGDLVRYLAELYVRFGEPDTASAKLRALADARVAEGEPGEAEELLEMGLRLAPDDFATLEALAMFHRGQDREDKFQETLLRAAQAYENRCDYGGALAPLEALVSAAPDNLAAIAKLVEYNEKLKRPEEAQRWRLQAASVHGDAGDQARYAEALREAVLKTPQDTALLERLAEAEWNLGDTAAALMAWRRLSQALVEAGKADQARAALEKAALRVDLTEFPDLARELFLSRRGAGDRDGAARQSIAMALALRDAGKPDDAAAAYQDAAECSPHDPEVLSGHVEFLKALGRPELPDATVALARALQMAGRVPEAEAALLAMLETDPGEGRAREELVELYGRSGDDAKMEQHLALLAETFDSDGDGDRSESTLRRLLELNPESIGARRMLVHQLRDRGDLEQAVLHLHALADIHRARGEAGEGDALQAEREAVQTMPGDITTRRRLVESLLDAGRLPAAADELEQVAAMHLEADRLPEAEAALDMVIKLDERLATAAAAAAAANTTPAPGAPPPASLRAGRLNARRLRAELLHRRGDMDAALEEFRALSQLAMGEGASVAPVATGSGTPRPGTVGAAAAAQVAAPPAPPLSLVPEYDFDTFVVGPNNQFAHATCLAIARSPGRQYNPLFLHADVGLGKTHLVNAIANHILARDPAARVIYTNSEDFTTELVDAIQVNAVPRFRARYKNVEALIVDDVQFLAGKERAQEEFFHIFNTLFQAKRQIVVTSDRPPSEIAKLEDRLRTRFGAGVIVDISCPDMETRAAILQSEVEKRGLEIAPALVRVVAAHIATNVRDLKGALNQVTALRDLKGETPDETNVTAMLESLYPRTPQASGA